MSAWSANRPRLFYGWRLIRKLAQASAEDAFVLISAGVAFFSLLSVIPALSALVALFGLLGDYESISTVLAGVRRIAPGPALELISGQLTRLVEAAPSGLALGALVSLAVSFWSAMQGMRQLLRGLSIAVRAGRRGFLGALAVTAGFSAAAFAAAILIVLVMGAALVATAQAQNAELALAFRLARWIVLVAVVFAFIAALYRWGPRRQAPGPRRVLPGALAATVAWLIASAVMTSAIQIFAQFHAAYGSLTGVVTLLLWMYVSTLVILLGARLNTELETLARAQSIATEA